jgi:hypothetical protein
MAVIHQPSPLDEPAQSAPLYSPGSVVLVKLRGHRETAGVDYERPAFVLHQWPATGDLQLFVMDLYGQGFQNAYPWQGVTKVLTDPVELNETIDALKSAVLSRDLDLTGIVEQIGSLRQQVADLRDTLESLTAPKQEAKAPVAPPLQPPSGKK